MKRSFTLLEMLVVLVIVSLIMAATITYFVSYLEDARYVADVVKVEGMLGVARARAIRSHSAYGVLFYVDASDGSPSLNKQMAVYIHWGGAPDESVRTGDHAAGYWNRVADQFRVVRKGIYIFHGSARVRGLKEPKSNFFVVVFNSRGEREVLPKNYRYIISDFDGEFDDLGNAVGDGRGDVTNCIVNDINDEWIRSDGKVNTLDSSIPIKNVVDLDQNDSVNFTELHNQWGLVVYNHAVWVELLETGSLEDAEQYLAQEATPLYLTRYGKIVRGAKGEGL